MKDKILILGANGFIGKNLQEYFIVENLTKDFNIIGVDYNELEESIFGKFYQVNALNFKELEKILIEEQPEYIINLIGITNDQDQEKLFELNVKFPDYLMRFMHKSKLPHKKIILIGSAAEYGENTDIPLSEKAQLLPIGEYGLSKQLQYITFDYFSRNSELSLNLVRFFNLVSPNMPKTLSLGNFAQQINSINDKGVLNTGNLSSFRDFINIHDALSGLIKVMINGKQGEVYNVCSGKSFTMKSLLESMIKTSGKTIQINEVERPLRKDIPISCGNNTKVKTLGWDMKIDVMTSINSMITQNSLENL